ncbi:MAG: hypothetical protein AAF755_05650 [Pseudomonadota bacterium]
MTTFAGCSDFAQSVDDTARAGTKVVVAEVIATEFDEVPKALLEPFTNCVIGNATAAELRGFAQDRIVGADAETTVAIRRILSRDSTKACLRDTSGA